MYQAVVSKLYDLPLATAVAQKAAVGAATRGEPKKAMGECVACWGVGRGPAHIGTVRRVAGTIGT